MMAAPAPRSHPAGRVAYRREVGAEHVGARVSVRWQDHHGVTRDVVGRLAAADDQVLIITDRSAVMHTVAARRVLASKLIPAHPRRAAEPVVGTRDAPVERDAARMLILTDRGALLIAHHPTTTSTVWTAPGGGIHAGENARDAVEREVGEELGIVVRAGPPVLRRTATFAFRGVWITQHETWFLAEPATTTDAGPATAPRAATGAGAEVIVAADQQSPDAATSAVRWWTSHEIEADDPTSTVRFEPPELSTLIRSIAADGPPEQPWELGRTIRDD